MEDMQDEIENSKSSLKSFGESAQKLGKKLTMSVTLPIIAIGTAMVMVASDAEEINAKFNTAFKGIEKSANATAEALADSFGLSIITAEKLLSGTGDLLKGFGATANQALTLSNSVQELAVDLASYNNLQGGAARASEIITKAI